jgi:hypothetical protein
VIGTGTDDGKGFRSDGETVATDPGTVPSRADVTRHHRVASAAQWVERPVGGVFIFFPVRRRTATSFGKEMSLMGASGFDSP